LFFAPLGDGIGISVSLLLQAGIQSGAVRSPTDNLATSVFRIVASGLARRHTQAKETTVQPEQPAGVFPQHDWRFLTPRI